MIASLLVLTFIGLLAIAEVLLGAKAHLYLLMAPIMLAVAAMVGSELVETINHHRSHHASDSQ